MELVVVTNKELHQVVITRELTEKFAKTSNFPKGKDQWQQHRGSLGNIYYIYTNFKGTDQCQQHRGKYICTKRV